MPYVSSIALLAAKNPLDVIGTRLIDNPEATLMCIGTTDGKTEAKNKGLGLRRAQYAKTYLTSNFAIAADRIGTETRNVPENPSALNIEDGMVENRRVDFKSNSINVSTGVGTTIREVLEIFATYGFQFSRYNFLLRSIVFRFIVSLCFKMRLSLPKNTSAGVTLFSDS